MTPAQRLTAVLSAAAISTALVVNFEGWERKTYADPVGIPTACAGVTKGIVRGKTYTDAECMELTAQELVGHGLEIDRCIKVPISDRTRAAFSSFAYNVGTGAFCNSTLARKLNAGDRPGACAELSRWDFAGGRKLAGLTRRRAAERAMCEAGLAS